MNKEEKSILQYHERGEWQPVKGMNAEILRYKQMAKQSLRKGRRINIRMPYQTLIASILHKYVTGVLN